MIDLRTFNSVRRDIERLRIVTGLDYIHQDAYEKIAAYMLEWFHEDHPAVRSRVLFPTPYSVDNTLEALSEQTTDSDYLKGWRLRPRDPEDRTPVLVAELTERDSFVGAQLWSLAADGRVSVRLGDHIVRHIDDRSDYRLTAAGWERLEHDALSRLERL